MFKVLLFLLIGFNGVSAIMTKDAVYKEISTCPSSPNCVSSLTKSKKHSIEPLVYVQETKEAFEKLKSSVLKIPRVRLIDSGSHHLHFVFTSKIMRFKDDVWFYFDESAKKIHFKSASRLGYGDHGVNRKRMEEIRALFN